MLIGAILVCAGLVANSLTFLPLTPYLVIVVIGFVLFGVGLGFFATPATDAAISSVPESQVRMASGIFKMGSSLGNSIGITVAATVTTLAAGFAESNGTGSSILAAWAAGDAVNALRMGTMVGLWAVAVIGLIALLAIVVTVPSHHARKDPQHARKEPHDTRKDVEK